ncbi:hypothetical protein M422DRAFT_262488 [Sphaerobolus stellatus SS14]|uniref:Uncharacterized protein n=1 Tax=Sphaerobolus stellatus (strain SS14) TaxID=990650 RepID=A0A0C9TXX2_SPHS4|nr:hypothetical protein M422DRAFT_262488 [Sphaerobolus stellatus SS14]
MEQCPSKFSFTRDETLDRLQEVWPKLGQYITDIGDEHDAFEKELAEEKSTNYRFQEEIDNLLDKITVMETQITSLQTSQQSNKNSSFRNHILTYDKQPNHWLLHMWKVLKDWHTNLMSIPNAIRDDSKGHFLEEDIDVAAWISKISAEIPHSAFMNQIKVVFGSCLNFETVFSGFKMDSLTLNHQSTQWIMHCSTPIRVGSQIQKGLKNDSQCTATVKLPMGADFLMLLLKHCSLSKEQIYTQIIPYMERYEEKQPYSATGMECAAYMQLNHHTPAPNKGKRPLTGSLQSRINAHAQQPTKTVHEPALPYEEGPPLGVPDVEMSTPVITGARGTLHDESTMNVDHELDDLYD